MVLKFSLKNIFASKLISLIGKPALKLSVTEKYTARPPKLLLANGGCLPFRSFYLFTEYCVDCRTCPTLVINHHEFHYQTSANNDKRRIPPSKVATCASIGIS